MEFEKLLLLDARPDPSPLLARAVDGPLYDPATHGALAQDWSGQLTTPVRDQGACAAGWAFAAAAQLEADAQVRNPFLRASTRSTHASRRDQAKPCPQSFQHARSRGVADNRPSLSLEGSRARVRVATLMWSELLQRLLGVRHNLSPQQLLACDDMSGYCAGGWPEAAYA